MQGKRATRSTKGCNINDSSSRGSVKPKTRQSVREVSSLSMKKQLSSQKPESSSLINTSTPAKGSRKVPQNESDSTLLNDDIEDEIALVLRDTPRALRMKGFFRDEFLSSQTTDSQLEVRWDHTSPDAYKRLRKVGPKKGKPSKEDLSDLVCKLVPSIGAEDEGQEMASSTPPMLCSWLQANKANSLHGPFEGQIFKNNHRIKRGMKKKRRNHFEKIDDVLNGLHKCLERDDGENMQESSRSSKSLVEGGDHNVKDVNRNIISNGTDSSSLLPPDVARTLLDEEEDNDLWSDDDFFEDNSFILQATQIPSDKIGKFSSSAFGGKRKEVSPVLDQPKNKSKRCVVSPQWEKDDDDDDLIPPSCATNSKSVSAIHGCLKGTAQCSVAGSANYSSTNAKRTCEKTVVNSHVKYNNNNINGNNISITSGSAGRKSLSPFRKHSSFSDFEGKKTTETASSGNTDSSSLKSPWRKTNSFSGRKKGCDNSFNTTDVGGRKSSYKQGQITEKSNCVGRSQVGGQHMSSNQRAAGEKTVVVEGQKTTPCTRKSASLSTVGDGEKCPSVQSKGSSTLTSVDSHAARRKESVNRETSPKNQTSPSFKREYLDTSWSDELLRQLAIPDEILESQADVTPKAEPPKSEATAHHQNLGELEDVFDSDTDFSINDSLLEDTVAVVDKPYACKQNVINSSKIQKCPNNRQNQDSFAQPSSKKNGHVHTAKTSSKTSVLNEGLSKKSLSSQVGSSQSRFTFRHTSARKSPPNNASKTTFTRVKNASPKSADQMSTRSIEVNTITSPTAAEHTGSNTVAEIYTEVSLLSTQALLEDDSFNDITAFDTQSIQPPVIENDSFMQDDALFESQIMAMLDEVESQASQNPKCSSDDSERISCSPEEIEKKRLAALEKLKHKKKT